MNTVLLVLAIVVVLLVAVVMKAKSAAGLDDGKWPFIAKKPLTNVEQILYWRLLKALPDHIVLAQVGLSQLLRVTDTKNFHAWNNRIDRKSADFVVCQKDASIVAVIELDDATHQRKKRKDADATKDKALSDAGLRIIRWQAKTMPDEAAIRREILPSHAQVDQPILAEKAQPIKQGL